MRTEGSPSAPFGRLGSSPAQQHRGDDTDQQTEDCTDPDLPGGQEYVAIQNGMPTRRERSRPRTGSRPRCSGAPGTKGGRRTSPDRSVDVAVASGSGNPDRDQRAPPCNVGSKSWPHDVHQRNCPMRRVPHDGQDESSSSSGGPSARGL